MHESQYKTFQFSGYASVFGVVDLGGDQIERGAFIDSLKKRPLSHIPLLYQHKQEEPIGRWLNIEERQKGLYVWGEINLDVQRGREIKALMIQRAVSGLSIGFKAKYSTVSPQIRANLRAPNAPRIKQQARRILTQIDLFEISIVPMPMLPRARIDWLQNNALEASPSAHHSAETPILAKIQHTNQMLQQGVKHNARYVI